MSIVSSRVTSISSILKGSGVRSSIINQDKRVCFKLPKDIKSVLLNYEKGENRKVYEDMKSTLKDTNVKDIDLLDLINGLQECIPMLEENHNDLIKVLLNINWTNRSSEIAKAFKNFVEDLMCMHIYHSKLIFDKLVDEFRFIGEGDTLWENGRCPDNHKAKISHVHDLLEKILRIMPMSSDVLIQSLTARYPQTSEGTLVTERYLYSLLQITNYAPHLRREILFLIINRLVMVDVGVPPSEIQCYEDMEEDIDNEAIFELDERKDDKSSHQKEMRHPLAQLLDVCMDQVLSYIYNYCYKKKKLHILLVKEIYNDLIHIFDRLILPTHESHHVQFLMFYFCSFKPIVVETFVKWLWRKVSNPNVASVTRQTAVSYISSLLARANFVSVGLIQNVLSEMSTWIHIYISSQDSLECANSDVRMHAVFYSVCQAMFYLLAFRHKEIIDEKTNLLFLQGLNISNIVTCRLNPLKVCHKAVVQNFAAVARNYQLAYCYTVIERNSRSDHRVRQGNQNLKMFETFFPFDPYLLVCSGNKISPLYNNSQCSTMNSDHSTMKSKPDCEEDDFMDDSILNAESVANSYNKFSYSTSPGFMHT